MTSSGMLQGGEHAVCECGCCGPMTTAESRAAAGKQGTGATCGCDCGCAGESGCTCGCAAASCDCGCGNGR